MQVYFSWNVPLRIATMLNKFNKFNKFDAMFCPSLENVHHLQLWRLAYCNPESFLNFLRLFSGSRYTIVWTRFCTSHCTPRENPGSDRHCFRCITFFYQSSHKTSSNVSFSRQATKMYLFPIVCQKFDPLIKHHFLLVIPNEAQWK